MEKQKENAKDFDEKGDCMNRSLHEKAEEIWCCLQLAATSETAEDCKKIVNMSLTLSSGFPCSGEESKPVPWGIICHELLSKASFPASGASSYRVKVFKRINKIHIEWNALRSKLKKMQKSGLGHII